MHFSRKRGRPAQQRAERDCGTQELAAKRAMHMTSEPLDLALSLGFISEKQHWAGNHYRWLYTLCYGSPHVRAVNPAASGDTTPKNDDPLWRETREKEFHAAREALSQAKCRMLVTDICVFGTAPGFFLLSEKFEEMRPVNWRKNPHVIELSRFKKGLDALVKIF